MLAFSYPVENTKLINDTLLQCPVIKASPLLSNIHHPTICEKIPEAEVDTLHNKCTFLPTVPLLYLVSVSVVLTTFQKQGSRLL